MTDLKPASNYRPYLWWVAALAWGVANILFHKQANDVARRLVVVMGLQVFLWSTRAAFLGGAVFVLVFRRNFYRDSQIFKRLLIFVPLAAALDLCLVIYPSERIHYPQYAVLTWLAYKATGQAFPAALMSFIFGYVDEANQHWMLYANDPTAYFDWNDIVLNLIAALAGLVLLPQAARVSNLSNLPTRTIAAAAAAWALGISLLVFLLNPDPYLMRNQKGDSFWRKSGVETHYHVLTASEGAILLGVILIITGGFYWPDRPRPPHPDTLTSALAREIPVYHRGE
jgi:hypothetical protein